MRPVAASPETGPNVGGMSLAAFLFHSFGAAGLRPGGYLEELPRRRGMRLPRYQAWISIAQRRRLVYWRLVYRCLIACRFIASLRSLAYDGFTSKFSPAYSVRSTCSVIERVST